MKDEIRKIKYSISEDIREIIKVQNFKFSAILDLFNNSDEDKELLLENLINDTLRELKDIIDINLYLERKTSREVDNITDYFIFGENSYDNFIEECDSIADDILFKVVGYKNRKLDLPIKISIIKDYCFPIEIKQEQFFNALVWIELRFICILEYVKYNQLKK